MRELIEQSISKGMTYSEYRSLTSELVKAGKTTGPNQSESMIHYTLMNDKRMNRLDKIITPSQESIDTFEKLSGDYHWLVISESWCGDASQIVPVFNALAELSNSIEMRIVLRDDNPELMDQFEQNGSRAIPLVIAVKKESFEVLGVWGARPKPAQRFVDEYKSLEVKPPYEQLSLTLQKWYNQDKTSTTQQELVDFIKAIESRVFSKAA